MQISTTLNRRGGDGGLTLPAHSLTGWQLEYPTHCLVSDKNVPATAESPFRNPPESVFGTPKAMVVCATRVLSTVTLFRMRPG